MRVAVLCTALLGVLLFALGANVSRIRATRSAAEQFPTDPGDALLKAVRAHGNAAEYVPMLALLMLAAAALQPGVWTAVMSVGVTIARFSHAAALLTSASLAEVTALRTVTALATYATGLALSLALAVSVL